MRKYIPHSWNDDRKWGHSKKQDQKGHTDRLNLGNGLLTTCRAPFSEALQRTQKHINLDCFPRNTLASLSLDVKWSSILCEISAGSSPSLRESYSQQSLVKPLAMHFTHDTKYLYNRCFVKSYQTRYKPILTKILVSEIRSLSISLELRYRKSTCSPRFDLL